MKIKLYFAFVALLLFISTAKAQLGPHIGIHYMYGTSTIIDRERWGGADYNYEYKSANIGGIAVGYNFANLFGVEGEVNYAWLGVNTKQPATGTQFERDIEVEYIQIPIMFKATTGPSTVRFMGSIGPQIGFMTAARSFTSARIGTAVVPVSTPTQQPEPAIPPSFMIADESTQVTTFTIPASEQNIRGSMRDIDVGALLQLGTEIHVAQTVYLTLALRGYYGFTNINRADQVLSEAPVSPKEKLGNAFTGINFGVHYILP